MNGFLGEERLLDQLVTLEVEEREDRQLALHGEGKPSLSPSLLATPTV